MPIYEYKCSQCEKEFEVMQRITAEPLTECEACGGKLNKLISQSAFILKGTGWYQTDFADKKPTSDKAADESATSKEAASKEAAPKEAASNGAASKGATPKEATSKEATPQVAAPRPASSGSCSPASSAKKE